MSVPEVSQELRLQIAMQLALRCHTSTLRKYWTMKCYRMKMQILMRWRPRWKLKVLPANGRGNQVCVLLRKIRYTHYLSSGIRALEEIAAEDHGDYNTWMDLNQSAKVWVGVFAAYRRNGTRSARLEVHGTHIPSC